MRLKNKVAVVTGAAGGIGLEVANMFLCEGASVAAVDQQAEPLGPLRQLFPERLFVCEANITDESAVGPLVQQAIHQFKRIDILVNVIGIAQAQAPVEGMTLTEWNRIMAVNVTSQFLMSRAVIPIMKKQKSGVIVNVASIAAERPRPGLSAYIASKGASVALTKALASELATHRIRANVINPGPTHTKMLGKFSEEGKNAKTFRHSVPLGTLMQPSDIANAAVYLCSDEARNVTGSVFNIDGGLIIIFNLKKKSWMQL